MVRSRRAVRRRCMHYISAVLPSSLNSGMSTFSSLSPFTPEFQAALSTDRIRRAPALRCCSECQPHQQQSHVGPGAGGRDGGDGTNTSHPAHASNQNSRPPSRKQEMLRAALSLGSSLARPRVEGCAAQRKRGENRTIRPIFIPGTDSSRGEK